MFVLFVFFVVKKRASGFLSIRGFPHENPKLLHEIERILHGGSVESWQADHPAHEP